MTSKNLIQKISKEIEKRIDKLWEKNSPMSLEAICHLDSLLLYLEALKKED